MPLYVLTIRALPDEVLVPEALLLNVSCDIDMIPFIMAAEISRVYIIISSLPPLDYIVRYVVSILFLFAFPLFYLNTYLFRKVSNMLHPSGPS